MKVIILAGGKGKRLKSDKHDLPKALREANGRAMLDYVLENTAFCDETIIVVGYKKEAIIEHTEKKHTYVYQSQQLGTGHAVLCAHPALFEYDGPVLVAFGDMPLFTEKTYQHLFEVHKNEGADCTILAGELTKEQPMLTYGRIVKNEKGEFAYIKEDKDCTDNEKEIRELNVGVLVCDSKKMFECLEKVGNKNKQNEYYLTQLPEIMKENGYKVVLHTLHNSNEIYGANTAEELTLVEQILKERSNK